jgi:GGDEF domain-containing protein
VVSQFGFSYASRRDIYDGETGVYAKWYFERRLDEECARSVRSGTPITLVCLNVGDGSALTAGYRLRRHVRDYDLIGRLGRGRFAVAVLDAGLDVADAIGDRLRVTIEMGADVGLAWYPVDGANARQLLASATKRLLNDAA